jgi:hypothetical protein
MLIWYSCRVQVKNAPVSVLRAWCHTRRYVYVFIEECFQNSYSGFIYLFFRKEIVYSVFVMNTTKFLVVSTRFF